MANDPAERNELARAEVLGSIRRHLTASQPFDSEYGHRHHGARAVDAVTFSDAHEEHDLVSVFQQAIAAVGASCVVVDGPQGAVTELMDILPRDAKVAISDSPLVREITSALSPRQTLESPDAATLFGCDVGITEAQWGIAETGTLVLDSGAERSRLISLVPPVHICFIRADRIRLTMAEILASINPQLSPTVTFITGASRTSDIELTLAIGVHGPGELHVIVYSRAS